MLPTTNQLSESDINNIIDKAIDDEDHDVLEKTLSIKKERFGCVNVIETNPLYLAVVHNKTSLISQFLKYKQKSDAAWDHIGDAAGKNGDLNTINLIRAHLNKDASDTASRFLNRTFVVAAIEGHYEVVVALFGDEHITLTSEKKAFMGAGTFGHTNILEFLMKHTFVEVDDINELLTYALTREHFDSATYLLNYLRKKGLTYQDRHVLQLAMKDSVQALSMLYDFDIETAGVCRFTTNSGYVINTAVTYNAIKVLEFLENKGAVIDITELKAYSYKACQHQSIALIKAIMALFKQDDICKYSTVLSVAISDHFNSAYSAHVVFYLLEHDPALQLAIKDKKMMNKIALLSAKNNNTYYLKKCLDAGGKLTNHWKPLYIAVKEDSLDFLKYAISNSFYSESALNHTINMAFKHSKIEAITLLAPLCNIKSFSLSESVIKKHFGAPKAALVNLDEAHSCWLITLLKRYFSASKASPLAYLTTCPDWQKEAVIEVIMNNTSV